MRFSLHYVSARAMPRRTGGPARPCRRWRRRQACSPRGDRGPGAGLHDRSSSGTRWPPAPHGADCESAGRFRQWLMRLASRACLPGPAARCPPRLAHCRHIPTVSCRRQRSGPGGGMRRNRCAKIVATLGPASSTQGADPRAGRRRRRRVPLQLQPRQPRGPCGPLRARARGRGGARPADRHDHGPAGPEAAGRPLRRGPRRPEPAATHFRLDLDPAPGDQTRVNLPHPEIFAVLQPGQELLLDDGRIRLRVEQLRPGLRARPRWSTAAGCPTARA